MKTLRILLYAAVIICISSFTHDKKPAVSRLGKPINDFVLKNTDNTLVSLKDYSGAKGFIIIFTCNHCPFAKLYSQRLNDLNSKYKDLGVPLLAINSMDTSLYEEESFKLMKEKAETDHFSFPYLYDAMQIAGKSFGANHTPQAYVIWKENTQWIIKYSGAVDDNGEHPELATSYVGDALDELLQNKPVSKPEIESFGCRIFYRK